MNLRLVIRGFAHGERQFEDRLTLEMDALDALMPALAGKHAAALASHDLHMIEIEFLGRAGRTAALLPFWHRSRRHGAAYSIRPHKLNQGEPLRMMDLTQVIADLQKQRDQISVAIMTLQSLSTGQKRRGRKPGWMAQLQTQQPQQTQPGMKRRGRPAGSKNKGVETAG